MLNRCLLAGLFALVLGCSRDSETGYLPSGHGAIRIGVLLPLSGPGSSSGQAMEAAVSLADQDIRTYLSRAGGDVELILDVADTRTDTAEALAQAKRMFEKGIRMIVGPYSSEELAHLKPWSDAKGMLLVSPSSVAVSLAVKGDNIFRFAPPDRIQGKAMSKLLKEDKIKILIPLVRNDVWGNDLVAATGTEFTAYGGQVHGSILYEPATTSFAPALGALDAAVAEESKHTNPNDIAIYLVSFSEGTDILAKAKAYNNLNNVYWYGSSAFAQNALALQDTTAALFAYTHGMSCPAYALDDGARSVWEPLAERIHAMIGRYPDTYAYTAYDALWVLFRTARAAGTKMPIESLCDLFMTEANAYYGASGNTRLDDNGDRQSGNYDFWAVKKDTLAYGWKRVARYNSFTGTLTRQVK